MCCSARPSVGYNCDHPLISNPDWQAITPSKSREAKQHRDEPINNSNVTETPLHDVRSDGGVQIVINSAPNTDIDINITGYWQSFNYKLL